ncbi:helix-turn-helix transcriptional regulator [Candidatus Moduliflexota bacterium]
MQRGQPKQYLSEVEVSDRTGIATPTLRNHRHQRKGIPYIKVGRRVLYDVLDVDGYLQKRKIKFEEEEVR